MSFLSDARAQLTAASTLLPWLASSRFYTEGEARLTALAEAPTSATHEETAVRALAVLLFITTAYCVKALRVPEPHPELLLPNTPTALVARVALATTSLRFAFEKILAAKLAFIKLRAESSSSSLARSGLDAAALLLDELEGTTVIHVAVLQSTSSGQRSNELLDALQIQSAGGAGGAALATGALSVEAEEGGRCVAVLCIARNEGGSGDVHARILQLTITGVGVAAAAAPAVAHAAAPAAAPQSLALPIHSPLPPATTTVIALLLPSPISALIRAGTARIDSARLILHHHSPAA